MHQTRLNFEKSHPSRKRYADEDYHPRKQGNPHRKARHDKRQQTHGE